MTELGAQEGRVLLVSAPGLDLGFTRNRRLPRGGLPFSKPPSATRPPPAVAAKRAVALDRPLWSSHITSMALSRKKATTIALDPQDDRLLSRAARERGVSRSAFVRQHLALVLEQYRRHPKPRSAGIVRGLTERGDERELFAGGR